MTGFYVERNIGLKWVNIVNKMKDTQTTLMVLIPHFPVLAVHLVEPMRCLITFII